MNNGNNSGEGGAEGALGVLDNHCAAKLPNPSPHKGFFFQFCDVAEVAIILKVI